MLRTMIGLALAVYILLLPRSATAMDTATMEEFGLSIVSFRTMDDTSYEFLCYAPHEKMANRFVARDLVGKRIVITNSVTFLGCDAPGLEAPTYSAPRGLRNFDSLTEEERDELIQFAGDNGFDDVCSNCCICASGQYYECPASIFEAFGVFPTITGLLGFHDSKDQLHLISGTLRLVAQLKADWNEEHVFFEINIPAISSSTPIQTEGILFDNYLSIDAEKNYRRGLPVDFEIPADLPEDGEGAEEDAASLLRTRYIPSKPLQTSGRSSPMQAQSASSPGPVQPNGSSSTNFFDQFTTALQGLNCPNSKSTDTTE